MESTKIKSTAPDEPIDLVARIFIVLLGLLPVIAVYAPKGMVLLVGSAAVALLFDQGVRKDLRGTPLPLILVVSLPLILWSLIAVIWSPSPEKALRLWGAIILLLAAARILSAGVARISVPDRHRLKTALIWSAGLFIVLVGIENITEGFIVKALKGTRGKGIDDYKAWLTSGNTIMAVCAWPMIAAVASRTNIYAGAAMFAAITIMTVFGISDASVLAMAVSGLVFALVLWGKRWALAGIAALSFVGAVATPFLVQVLELGEKAYPSEPGLTTCWVCGCHWQYVRLMFWHAQPLERTARCPAPPSRRAFPMKPPAPGISQPSAGPTASSAPPAAMTGAGD